MKEFYKTTRFQMAIPDDLQGIAGGVIMPAGIAMHTVTRRNISKKYPHLARRLLDPQLYLIGLNPATSRKVCANLASYPWFPVKDREPFESGKHKKQSEWKKALMQTIHEDWVGVLPATDNEVSDAVRICLECQKSVGVEALVLPTPLTGSAQSAYDVELNWLDKGLALAKLVAPDLPVYASIALSDTAVRGDDPWANPLLDIIIDQLTSRDITHAYVVLEQANENGYYCTHFNTIGALLRLTDGLKRGGVERVFMGYAGTAGLLALAAGADAWSTGWYRGERRLKLADLEDARGMANPTYYTHSMAGEFHLDKDLDRVVAAGFLPRLIDETPASKGLLTALKAKKSSNVVPEWRYSQSNTAASIEHFLTVCIRETNGLGAIDAETAEATVQQWLEGAAKLASDLYSVGAFNERTSVSHQSGWQKAFEAYVKNKLP
jgi:hypothetical protein